MLHLEHDPTLYEEIEKGRESVQNVDYGKVAKEFFPCQISAECSLIRRYLFTDS